MESITKGLTKLNGNLYINKKTGDLFTVHGTWMKSSVGSIVDTELFDIFNESFGTKEGNKMRKAIAKVINDTLK